MRTFPPLVQELELGHIEVPRLGGGVALGLGGGPEADAGAHGVGPHLVDLVPVALELGLVVGVGLEVRLQVVLEVALQLDLVVAPGTALFGSTRG